MNELITKYLQGEANEAEKKQLLEWLQQDEENKKEFSAMRDAWLASGIGSRFSSEYKEKAFNQFIHNVETRKNRTLSIQLGRIAAAVVLLIVTTGIGYMIGNKSAKQDIPVEVIVKNNFLMGADSKGSVVLPDGSKVWLHGNSKLTYPDVFAATSRNVKVNGEAYFEVTENKDAPFIVETDNIHIKVLGTQFNMKDYDNQSTTETVLVSGKVEAFIPRTNERIMMKPNQKLLWDSVSKDYKLTEVDAKDYIVWINDKLVFNKEKLQTILFKMERWYNIKIVVDKKVDLNQRLSLTIRHEDKEEIFKLLGLIAPIRYQIDNKTATIRPK
ncbi:FecR family protein [Bacteroides sp. 519]|uniref:FecR family protein n=1 Tax=Bacteroides sp. 519 TaxID=2302937 RepID=UPI0013D85533|nr:FecR family protein [Bacteroides sp. 519]NDV57158.1 FecR family protein [Bacteroides sp. 519]